MTRMQRMRPVVQHTDKKEQQALLEVAKSQNQLEVEQNKLKQLQQYKLEYQQKTQADTGVQTPFALQEFHRFLQQLDETIAAQRTLIDLKQQELEQKRRAWEVKRIDAKAMQKVVERMQKEEDAEADRTELKEQDDTTQITQRRNQQD